MRYSARRQLMDNLSRIKQETSEALVRTLAHSSYRIANEPNYFEEAIYKMASERFDSVDDYIMLAKQAIAHAERHRDEDQ